MNLRFNLSKGEPVTFNPIGVCESKQLYEELGLDLEHESLGLDTVVKFCDGPHLQIKTVKGRRIFFF